MSFPAAVDLPPTGTFIVLDQGNFVFFFLGRIKFVTIVA